MSNYTEMYTDSYQLTEESGKDIRSADHLIVKAVNQLLDKNYDPDQIAFQLQMIISCEICEYKMKKGLEIRKLKRENKNE